MAAVAVAVIWRCMAVAILWLSWQWRCVAVAVAVAVHGGMAVAVQSWGVFRSSVLAGGWVYWGCHGVDVGSRTLSFHVLSASLLR